MSTITHEGVAYPVTDAWDAANNQPWPDFAGMERSTLDASRLFLLEVSNARALTSDETARLAALTNHYNVRNALIFLAGRPHTDFGFTGVDQIHGNRWTAPCGCQLHNVFDHHVAVSNDPSGLVVHPHTPRYVCETHAHLTGDLHALHAAAKEHANAQAEAAPPAEA